MFGLFKKKKISKRDDQFVTDLAIFSSDIHFAVNSINDQMSESFSKRVLEVHLDKNFETSEYSASDSYLNELTGDIFQPTLDGRLNPIASQIYYTEVDDFLKLHPRYNSEIAIELMDLWYRILSKVRGFEQ